MSLKLAGFMADVARRLEERSSSLRELGHALSADSSNLVRGTLRASNRFGRITFTILQQFGQTADACVSGGSAGHIGHQ